MLFDEHSDFIGGTLTFFDVDESLDRYRNTCKLSKPDKHNINILTSILEDPELEDYLLGADRTVWSDPELASDLISLNTEPNFDSLTLVLVKRFLGIYHNYIGRRLKSTPDSEAGLYNYNEAHIRLPVRVLNVVASSTLPILAIIVLHVVDGTGKRLAAIAAFTAVFSALIALTTKAKSEDTFAATAASVRAVFEMHTTNFSLRFAAVQVVFIGTNGSNCGH